MGLIKLIKKGAEANIYLASWFNELAIAKIRLPKAYRNRELDIRIRRTRTFNESKFLKEARKAGVPTPLVYFVDRRNMTIVMQYIEGKRLKDELQSGDLTHCKEVGMYIARLHKHGIVHNDPTTSNFIIHDNDLVMIDFGLAIHSDRLEDKAVDIHLLKEALAGGHSELATRAFSQILDGYEEVLGKKGRALVLKRVGEIERRGRYTK